MAELTFAIIQTFVGNIPYDIKMNLQQLDEGKISYAENEDNARICISSGTLIREC
jgi:hypothetical protein